MERLGREPDPSKAPLEIYHFPLEVQEAFAIHAMLPDRWDGMSGTYMGKYWDGIDYFFKLYEVENPRIILYFMKLYENQIVSYRAEKAEQKRKADERKSKSGGKNYTYNVKG